MRNLFLMLAIAGAVVPYIFFIDFFANEGIDLASFTGALFVNGAAGGFTADLLITSAVFWLFLLQDGAARPWAYVLINLSIGLSCALPLYLYIRSGRDVSQTTGQTA